MRDRKRVDSEKRGGGEGLERLEGGSQVSWGPRSEDEIKTLKRMVFIERVGEEVAECCKCSYLPGL